MYVMNVKTIELSKKVQILRKILAQNRIISRYRSIFRGKGLEFEGFRDYVESDDAKSIDWKSSLKSDRLLIKEFKEERSMDVYFLYDASSSMLFGSTEKLKSEYAAEMVASLADLIITVGDKAGLLVFNRDIVKVLPPEGGVNQLYYILKELVKIENYGGTCNLSKVLNYMIKVVNKNSLLFIVSDFIGLDSNWQRYLKLTKKRFDVIGLAVIDPRDMKLPRDVGNVVISDPFTKRTMLINPKEIGDEYESQAEMRLKNIEMQFIDNNADFIRIMTDESFIKPLITFFKRREKLLST